MLSPILLDNSKQNIVYDKAAHLFM